MDLTNIEYTETYLDEHGEYKSRVVRGLDESISSIIARVNRLTMENESLSKENESLKSDHYESDELQKMKELLDRMHDEWERGYPITLEEDSRIMAWEQKHVDKKHNGHNQYFTYQFTPTEFGTEGKVICGACGEEFIFQEIGQ